MPDIVSHAELTERRVQRLLRRCARNDVDALSELLELTGAGMLHTARSVTPSEDDATEAVAEAYAEVWHRAQRLEGFGRSPVRTMLDIARCFAREAATARLAVVLPLSG